ncbi:MAG: N-acetylmuramoyl-L-alanine amidase, partial [Candidatus Hydrogenedentes bacterium]|nr:N-acetylmuramoyl-L-alanine amidase [Candidatus Hydrogenedentota bacterium]
SPAAAWGSAPGRAICVGLAVCVCLAAGRAARADDVRAALEPGVNAVLREGRMLFVECRPPAGKAAEAYLARYLRPGEDWRTYADKGAVAIRYLRLNPDTQRAVLLGIFRDDFVDARGWTHTVKYTGSDQETLWSLCEWLTGRGSSYKQVAEVNRLATTTLQPGQRILVPMELLLDVMKTPTVAAPPPPPPGVEPDALADIDWTAPADLTFVTKDNQQYALYRLKPGEALYTAVVVQFTDFRDNAAILEACEVIQRASGIPDVRDMEPGTKVLIPIAMLSDRFKPASSPERREYEHVLEEANRLRGQVSSKNLQGVVVILDPGHGGRDQGAATNNGKFALFEDELNYDIMCRIKRLLETQTGAKVHVTMRDRSQGYTPRDDARFVHDTDEELLTDPPYANTDATRSANLRWYLANSIYRSEVAAGVDPRKIVFTSIHTDALFNDKLRGAMIYIPGARYRRDTECPSPRSFYNHYRQVREAPSAQSTAAERRRDEALSRNFAAALLVELGRQQIKRHDSGDPIRNVIRRSRTSEYVPAVLRNSLVPTKILIETANMTNPTDCRWLAEAWWRQRFAEAYVDALKAHFGS